MEWRREFGRSRREKAFDIDIGIGIGTDIGRSMKGRGFDIDIGSYRESRTGWHRGSRMEFDTDIDRNRRERVFDTGIGTDTGIGSRMGWRRELHTA
jgi:hypothetical protein